MSSPTTIDIKPPTVMTLSTKNNIRSIEEVTIQSPIAFLMGLLLSISTSLGYKKKHRHFNDCPKGLYSCVNCSNIENGKRSMFCKRCSIFADKILNKLYPTIITNKFESLLIKVCMLVVQLKNNRGKTSLSFNSSVPVYILAYQIANLYMLGELEYSSCTGSDNKIKYDSEYKLAVEIENLSLKPEKKYTFTHLTSYPKKRKFKPKLEKILETDKKTY